MSKYKAGDLIKSKYDDSTEGRHFPITCITPGGNIIVKFGTGDEVLRDEAHIDQYFVKVVPFFEVGKIYNHISHSVTYEVVYVTTLDGARWASAVRKGSWGDLSLSSLNEEDFRAMEEASDND